MAESCRHLWVVRALVESEKYQRRLATRIEPPGSFPVIKVQPAALLQGRVGLQLPMLLPVLQAAVQEYHNGASPDVVVPALVHCSDLLLCRCSGAFASVLHHDVCFRRPPFFLRRSSLPT